VGYANKQINTANLKFPDQFDGKFFDNKMPTTGFVDKNNIGYLDMQVGMNYAYFPTDNIYVNTGFSVHHVNRPQESFFSESGESARVPMRYIGFLNGSFKLNDQVIINPNIYYTRQANVTELVGGLLAHYNLSGDGMYQLIGGAYYRHKEAIIPMVGLGYNDITFTFSYDATMSSLKNFNQSRGAFEFSLIKQGILNPNGNRVTPCPTFRTY
jgi:type IX secretion system PorP/SprF family membrane protein